jgi:hypothetical protein
MGNVDYIACPKFTIMEYNRIIAITGMGGLYELLSSKADGAIVRSLDDKQTKFVSSRVHNFSHLESIEVYTVRENINLVDLFKAIQTSGEKLPDDKDAAAVKGFFAKVYPDMDFERIYNSDMKKMIKWYNLLSTNDVEFKLSAPPEEEGADSSEEEGQDEAVAVAPVKAKVKTAPAEKEIAPAAKKAAAEEAPAKKKAASAHADAPAEAKKAAKAEPHKAESHKAASHKTESPKAAPKAETSKAAAKPETPKAAAKPAASKAAPAKSAPAKPAKGGDDKKSTGKKK